MLNPSVFTPLHRPELLQKARQLPGQGQLALSRNQLCYLDLSDDYIHCLFPLLKDTPAQQPAYFGPGGAGAHISVVYPEEKCRIPAEWLGQTHAFTPKNAFMAELGGKHYYVVTVEAPSLLKLRRELHLPDLLPFKEQWVDFHITIGVCPLAS